MAGWRFMMPVLAKAGFRVYAPDRPGYGDADAREEYWPRLGWKSHVDFVREFADALCLDRFHIGGNSQGMQNATHFLINNPERIISAALIATGGLAAMAGVDPAKLVQANPRFVYPPFEGSKESMQVLMESIIFKKSAIDDDLLTMRTRAGNLQKESLAAFQAGMRSEDPNLQQYSDIAGRFSKLTIPMIYLQGRQDVTLVLENIMLAEPLLPNIQFFYPDQCGHQGQTDQPEMFNQVFLEFFRDGKVSRKTAEWAGISTNRPPLASVVGD
jgi:pimeloyl-ACP methyl ester carboxylesterase